ncbi:glutathione-specific gamma-glutamylcyclotransferase 1-like [Amphiura filiformis]|uniref:glutathione-specific gamma-glutamylcyclotransferase 1-like n=1 Tax=Amphiura filiformis TaxID=82378 RepID=UPI003B2103BD
MSPHDFIANTNTKRIVWIFGYGSLVWKPDFEYTARKIGYLKGYVRRFWQGNVTHRGVPGRPARVATLIKDDSGSTWGVSFKLEGEEQIVEAFSRLNTRECILGGYDILNLPIFTTDGTTHQAVVFLATPECELYMGPSSVESMARDIVSSHGKCGSNTEYLFRLVDFMRECLPGVVDDHLFDLDSATKKLLKCNICSVPNSIMSSSSSMSRKEDTTSSEKVNKQYYLEGFQPELATVLA